MITSTVRLKALRCVSSLALLAWHLSSHANYTLSDLGAIGCASASFAVAINNTGTVVGACGAGPGATLWRLTGGPITSSPLSPSGTAYALNDAGQIVGQSTEWDPTGRATRWDTRSLPMTSFNLGTLDGASLGRSINAVGIIVGSSLIGGSTYRATLWTHSSVVDLGIESGGSYSEARGINDEGFIVGNSDAAAVIWDARSSSITSRRLPSLGGTFAFSQAINNFGQIVGQSSNADGTIHATLWQLSDSLATDLGVLPGGSHSYAFALNNLGQIVGISSTATSTGRAFIWQGGQMFDLNSMLDNGSEGWELEAANGINDSGQIVGYGRNGLGQSHAFLLTPVPEPSSLVMLSFGLLLLLLARKQICISATPLLHSSSLRTQRLVGLPAN